MNIKIRLVQMNSFVGNLGYNYSKIADALDSAKNAGADIVIFPELCLTGYPPEDLVYKKKFIEDNITYLQKIVSHSKGITAIVGFVNSHNHKITNSAAVISDGKLVYVYDKINLPNYSVFDEMRYFTPGTKIPVLDLGGNVRFGLGICEDIWVDETPALIQAKSGADFIININASPFYSGKGIERLALLKKLSAKINKHILYVNMTGGQDEIVFDGNSLVTDNKGRLLAAGRQFAEETIDVTVDFPGREKTPHPASPRRVEEKIDYVRINGFKPHNHFENPTKPVSFSFMSEEEEIYTALVIGVRDYMSKNGFKKAVIGLSGGIDSALTAAIAADAIGPENVLTLYMPSEFSAKRSFRDANKFANNLGVEMQTVRIEELFHKYVRTLSPFFNRLPFDIAEENLQARIRGNLLMAVSNKFGHLVLTTGNKSEMSTGYSTLYGDMAGGFSVLKDVYKTMVYKLALYRNKKAGFDLIPRSIIKRPPTAELRANQKDSDSLPDYSILDKILYYYIEKNMTYPEIMKLRQFDTEDIKKTIKLVIRSEYKRRQSPPGIKITPLALGKDRRMPITSGYMVID